MSAEQTRTEVDARRSALMAAAQSGDRVAYETLLRDCVPFIAGLACCRGIPADRTDDVVQETLLTLHRARDHRSAAFFRCLAAGHRRAARDRLSAPAAPPRARKPCPARL